MCCRLIRVIFNTDASGLLTLHDPSGMALPSARFQLIVGLGFPNAAHDSFKWSPSKTIIA